MLHSTYTIGGHSYTAASIAPTSVECQALVAVLGERLPYILHALPTEERVDIGLKLNDVAHAFALADQARSLPPLRV